MSASLPHTLASMVALIRGLWCASPIGTPSPIFRALMLPHAASDLQSLVWGEFCLSTDLYLLTLESPEMNSYLDWRWLISMYSCMVIKYRWKGVLIFFLISILLFKSQKGENIILCCQKESKSTEPKEGTFIMNRRFS